MQRRERSKKEPAMDSEFGNGGSFRVHRAGWEAGVVSRSSGIPLVMQSGGEDGVQ